MPAIVGYQVKVIVEENHVFPLLNQLVQKGISSTRILLLRVSVKYLALALVVNNFGSQYKLLRYYPIDINLFDCQIENLLKRRLIIFHFDSITSCLN